MIKNLTIFITIFLLSIANLSAFEILKEEKNSYQISNIKMLLARYTTEIIPHFKASKLLYFQGKDHVQIAYKVFKISDAKASIVIASGRTESMAKYQELILDLNNNGFNVFIYDHRGQGFSDRTQNVDHQLGDVDKFKYYVEDLKTFVDKIVKKSSLKKRFLLSHSMGGAIASLYLERYHHDFTAAVFSSPMHQPSIGGKFTSKLICNFFEKNRQKRVDYIFGGRSYDESIDESDYKIYTSSLRRYALVIDANEQYPETKIGAPSSRWVAQSCEYSKKSVNEAYKIKTPFILLQGGSDDIVNPSAQEKFCENAGKYCEAYTLKDSEHEIFIERDKIRRSALVKILNFFNTNI